jgi:cytochrome c oxidase subunit 4
MSHHVSSWQTNVVIFAALLILLVATLGCAYLPLGILHFPVAMAIATAKAYLIIMYFMHVRYSHRLTAVVVVSSFFWLGIMLVMTLNDYVSRGALQIPGK